MKTQFINNLSFKDSEAQMREVLQVVKGVLFSLEMLVEGEHEENFLQYLFDMESPGLVTYDRIDAKAEEDGLEVLRHLAFEETEGERGIRESPSIEGTHLLPVRLRKHNVGMEDKPKIASIGDYWDEHTTKELFDLLQEYQELFLASVAKLKGIKDNLGEMKIVLKPGIRTMKHRPY